MDLELKYERGSEPDTIDVCTKEHLFLGKIINQSKTYYKRGTK